MIRVGRLSRRGGLSMLTKIIGGWSRFGPNPKGVVKMLKEIVHIQYLNVFISALSGY